MIHMENIRNTNINTKKGNEVLLMHEFDDVVLQCFLDNQEQLFPEQAGKKRA